MNSSVAYAVEQSYLGGVGGSPTYVLPGTNTTVTDLSLDNFLTRIRVPNQRESIRSVAGQFEGGLSVGFNLSTSTFKELVFNGTDGSGNDILDNSIPTSAEWYIGADYEDSGSVSVAERVAKGWVCVQASIEYAGSDLIRVTLDGIYGDEAYNTSLTPGSLSDPGTETDFFEASLSINGLTQTKESGFTLSLNDLARFERGTSRQPIAAVPGPGNVELTTSSVFTESDQLGHAYGGTAATSPQDSMTGQSASLTYSPGGTTVLDFSLSECKPATYGWEDIVSKEDSLSESITWQVNGTTQTA